MIKGLFGLVKYPSTAGVLGLIWLGSAILVVFDKTLPILSIIIINMCASVFIGILGFRVERR